jgi:hypothetical protein
MTPPSGQILALSIGPIRVVSTRSLRQNAVSERSWFKIKDETMDNIQNCDSYINILGARGSVVVKALCYKPEGRGFDTR